MRVRDVGVATEAHAEKKTKNHSRERCILLECRSTPGQQSRWRNSCSVYFFVHFRRKNVTFNFLLSKARAKNYYLSNALSGFACVSTAPLGVAAPALLVMVDTPQQCYTYISVVK